jgi:hypothetical protein
VVIVGSTFFGLASLNLSPPCAFIIKSAFGTPKSFVWPQCDSKKLGFQKTEFGAIVLRQKWSCGQLEARFAGTQPRPTHETIELRWSRLSEQIFRVDKWSLCQGYAAMRRGSGVK